MELLVWLGAVVSLCGLTGLIWCIWRVWSARHAGLSDPELRGTVRKVLPINAAALFLSVIGLMLVIAGVLLG